MDLKESEILRETISNHWYYRSKARAMRHMLSATRVTTILDIGAGSGYFSRQLLAQSTAKEAWCVDVNYDRDFDSLERGKPIHFRRSIGWVGADLVLLMDVLEHVNDDLGLLRNSAGKVPRGSRFLISVPAFQFLWSGHDEFLEHKRRYQLSQIEKVIERAGLTVIHGAYFFGAVFPIAITIRFIENLFRKGKQQPRSQLKQHNLLVNIMLASLSQAELPLMLYNRIAGLTAFCLAKSN